LDRPTSGTNPIGFFNCEFLYWLKPYNDKSWSQSAVHDKEQLEKRYPAQAESYPGVIFNYTQPAEDAVDEALPDLKSALG